MPDTVIDRPLTAPSNPLSDQQLHKATRDALNDFLTAAAAKLREPGVTYDVDQTNNLVTAKITIPAPSNAPLSSDGYYKVQRLQDGSYTVSHAGAQHGNEVGSFFIQVNPDGSITLPPYFDMTEITPTDARKIIEDALHAIQNLNN